MTDDTLARLETAVRASWGYDDLAVYADHLQAIGDPRGEVMALDLVAPRDRNAPGATAWRTQRTKAIAAWVGHALADQVAPLVDLGFIKELKEADAAVLGCPAGDVVRAYEGTRIDELAARPRPWLERLAVTAEHHADDDCARLLVHAPRLVLLDVRGTALLARLPHPNVRYLKVALDGEGRIAMPAVTHLDLWILGDDAVPELALPALVSLDLARNTTLVFAAIDGRQIEHVTLPALADDAAVATVGRLLDTMPRLKTAKLARTYGGPRFGDALAARTPPVALQTAFPWPAPRTLTQYNTLVIEIPEEPFNDIVALPPLIAFLEQHYDGFAPDAQLAWTAIFEHVRPAQWNPENDDDWIAPEERPPVTLAIVGRAIDACEGLAARSWVEFRAHFRDSRRGLRESQPIRVSMYR